MLKCLTLEKLSLALAKLGNLGLGIGFKLSGILLYADQNFNSGC